MKNTGYLLPIPVLAIPKRLGRNKNIGLGIYIVLPYPKKVKEAKMNVIRYATEMNQDKIPSLVKEYVSHYEGEKITCPKDIADLLNSVYKLNRMCEEHFLLIGLNTKNVPIGVFDVSHGTVNSSYVHPREVFLRAVLCQARSVIIAHNHPSGDATPSRNDIEITQRLIKAGKIIGIDVMDHIIVGDTYVSLREEGHI